MFLISGLAVAGTVFADARSEFVTKAMKGDNSEFRQEAEARDGHVSPFAQKPCRSCTSTSTWCSA